jgi:hypothetical protein
VHKISKRGRIELVPLYPVAAQIGGNTFGTRGIRAVCVGPGSEDEASGRGVYEVDADQTRGGRPQNDRRDRGQVDAELAGILERAVR